jgi:hypothetical protein
MYIAVITLKFVVLLVSHETAKYGQESRGNRYQECLSWRGSAVIFWSGLHWTQVVRMSPLHDSQSRERVKYGHESRGLETKDDYAGEDQEQFAQPTYPKKVV